MKKTFYLLFVLLFSLSCKKEVNKATITYKINETSSYVPSYTVRYTLADGTTQSKGPITADKWSSDIIQDVEPGKYISFTVEGSGGGTYDMYIYINGRIDSHREAGDGFGPQTLNTQVPN